MTSSPDHGERPSSDADAPGDDSDPLSSDGGDAPDDSGPSSSDGDDEIASLGPAPAVAGQDRIHDDVRARLFGDVALDDTLAPEGTEASSAPSGSRAGRRIGRFRVLERLGRGGMGVVYRAYDPELDRPVAIKLLRPDVQRSGEPDAQARLLREAQAMARLSHPNVIVVHEVGTVDDRVFVAMEYVEGPTLREWLRTKRPWAEVSAVFLAAGHGLAAAHRAGLAHRDFKPENVLIDREGRVRVLDFGLARALGEPDAEPPRPSVFDSERPDVDSLHTPLTRTGAVMGTPAYMSPEQLLGNPADARSDQFSFCVALWEGLCGRRPFPGRDLPELSFNVVRGRIQDPPSDVRIPRRVLAALRRGLSVDPGDRFEHMEDLLARLRSRPATWWIRGLVVLAVGVGASLTTLAFRGQDASKACAGLSEQLVGIWDPSTRAEVDRAIRGTGRVFAPPVADTTTSMLDDYAARWLDLAEEACGAALVAQNADEAERRRDCLDERRVELGALVDALREGDDGMVQAAVTATADLTDLGACSDPRRLAAVHVEEDPAVREQVARARAELARAKAKGALGRYDEAVELASSVIDQAERIGSEALHAMGRMTRGTYRERAGDPEGAEADLRRAVALAQAGGAPGTRAQAMVRLVWVVGRDAERYQEARALGIQAGAVLELIGAPPLLHADLDNNLGTVSRVAGALDEALDYHRSALERRREVLGEDHPDVGRSLTNLGNVLSAQGRLPEAEDHLRRGLDHARRTLGPDHPSVAAGRSSLAFCLATQQRPEEALTEQHRALVSYERAFGPEHPSSLHARFNLAKIAQGLGLHTQAVELLREGLALRTATVGPDDPKARGWLDSLGLGELALGHRDAATHLERVLAIMEAQEVGDVRLARPRYNLARALYSTDPGRAEALVDAALEALREAEEGGTEGRGTPEVRLRTTIEDWRRRHR